LRLWDLKIFGHGILHVQNSLHIFAFAATISRIATNSLVDNQPVDRSMAQRHSEFTRTKIRGGTDQ